MKIQYRSPATGNLLDISLQHALTPASNEVEGRMLGLLLAALVLKEILTFEQAIAVIGEDYRNFRVSK